MLNSTVTGLSKHQFGRAAGVGGNLKTEVVDVNMMLVPDVRRASNEAAVRAVTAAERMSRRKARRYLYEEFSLDDRRELDDATLEILGFEDRNERAELMDRIYRDVSAMQQSTRNLEIIARLDRRRSARRGTPTPQDIADELWAEHESSLDLLEFPGDFVTRANEGDLIELPAGEIEVGEAMMDTDGLLGVGKVRVGGRDGEVIEVSSGSRARFLKALSRCHRAGLVRLPGDDVCDDAVSSFEQYRSDLRDRCSELARQRTSEQRCQKVVIDALLLKALQWQRP